MTMLRMYRTKPKWHRRGLIHSKRNRNFYMKRVPLDLPMRRGGCHVTQVTKDVKQRCPANMDM